MANHLGGIGGSGGNLPDHHLLLSPILVLFLVEQPADDAHLVYRDPWRDAAADDGLDSVCQYCHRLCGMGHDLRHECRGRLDRKPSVFDT